MKPLKLVNIEPSPHRIPSKSEAEALYRVAADELLKAAIQNPKHPNTVRLQAIATANLNYLVSF